MNKILSIVTLFVLMVVPSLMIAQPNWSATLTAYAGDLSYDLAFGFSPDATDGYDEGIDEYAPPAPPAGTFDAALTWVSGRFYTQILNGSSDDLVEHVYGIALTYDNDEIINISWDNTGWSDMMSTCLLQDPFGGGFINVDMINPELSTVNAMMGTFDYSDPVHPVLTLTNSALTNLTFKVTPTDYSEYENTAPK